MSKQRSMMTEVKAMVDSKRILDALLKLLTSNKAIGPEDLETVLQLTVRKLADTLFAQCIIIYTIDEEKNKIRHQKVFFTPYLYGGDDEKKNYFENKAAHLEKILLPMTYGVPGHILRTNQKALVADVLTDPHFYNLVESDSLFVPRSMIAVPMTVNGKPIGCIQAVNRCPDYEQVTQFDEDDVMLVEDIAQYTAKLIQKSSDPTLTISDREQASYVARLAKANFIEFDVNFKPDMELVKWTGEDILRRYEIMPIRLISQQTCAAVMANPNDFQRITDFEIVTGLKIGEKNVAMHSDIIEFINRMYPKTSTIDKAKQDIEKEYADVTTESREFRKTDLDLDNENAGPIVKLSSQIVEDAFLKGASDIHIEPMDGSMRVRYRIDGVLKEVMSIPWAAHRALISRFKIMSDLNISERRLPQDGRIIYRRFNSQYDLDLRVSSLPSSHGEKICARILDKTKSTLPLDKLGFSVHNLIVYRDIIQAPYGMILHCGPTGSGKSMSLYAALNEINSPEWNICTVEDPIEYTLAGLTQVQVKKDIGLTFASTLRSLLRQDPDIILVGEIRDLETAEISIEASLTGHLLFSTLHTNDAASAVARFTEMGIEPYMISTSLLCVCAQRLVRRVCGCRRMEAPTDDERGLLSRALDLDPITVIARSRGCKNCEDTGFKGRAGAHEILRINDEIRLMINHRKSVDEIKRAGREGGMRTLFEDLMEKVKHGITTLPEAVATARPDETHPSIHAGHPESAELVVSEEVVESTSDSVLEAIPAGASAYEAPAVKVAE